jgi:hypothetical protein
MADQNKLSSERIQAIFQPKLPSPFEHSQEISRSEGPPPDLLNFISSTFAASREDLFRLEPVLSPPKEKRHPRGLVVAGLAVCVAVLGLIVMSTGHRKNLEGTDSGAAPVQKFSPPTARPPGNPPAGTVIHSEQQTIASSDPPSDPVSTGTPIAIPLKILRPGPEAQWVAMLKKILPRSENTSAYNQALDGVSVWTNGRSGYYYCADSPYFAKVKPGSIMTQSSALQSGYQPKLGSYCP